jgi:hypothetical protein
MDVRILKPAAQEERGCINIPKRHLSSNHKMHQTNLWNQYHERERPTPYDK